MINWHRLLGLALILIIGIPWWIGAVEIMLWVLR